MKRSFGLPPGLSTFWLLAFSSTIHAHTWVEQLTLIASNGTFVGTPGYPRGFVPRLPDVDPDIGMTYLVPPNGRSTGNEILPTDLMCKQSQFIGNYTEGYPALTAAPGDQIAMIYQENGHVTQLYNSATKPVGSGTVYIYGTKQPANTDTYLGIHRVWNTAGTGGDQRGKLLATRPFDDGQCFQNDTSIHVPLEWERRAEFNPVANDLKSQSDFQVPNDAGTSGTYTIYWVWEWPTLDNTTGAVALNVSYTTCMDINMSANKLASAGSFDNNQIVDSRAIEAQLSTAFLVNPTIAEQLTGAAGAQPTEASAPGSSVSVPSSASSAPAGFITVTVTETAQDATVTVTETVNDRTSSHAATPTTSQAETSNKPSSSAKTIAASSSMAQAPQASGSVPPIAPFLSPSSQIAKAPAAASTLSSQLSSSSEPTSTTSASSLPQSQAHAPASSTSTDCPDMTPSATQTQTLAPNQSAATYLNGSLHNREFKLRGRIVRL